MKLSTEIPAPSTNLPILTDNLCEKGQLGNNDKNTCAAGIIRRFYGLNIFLPYFFNLII